MKAERCFDHWVYDLKGYLERALAELEKAYFKVENDERMKNRIDTVIRKVNKLISEVED